MADPNKRKDLFVESLKGGRYGDAFRQAMGADNEVGEFLSAEGDDALGIDDSDFEDARQTALLESHRAYVKAA